MRRIFEEPGDSIGQRIQRARRWRNVTQVELARALGISQNAMVSIEKDRSIPRGDRLRDIAIALRVRVDYLLSLTDELEPDNDWKGNELEDIEEKNLMAAVAPMAGD